MAANRMTSLATWMMARPPARLATISSSWARVEAPAGRTARRIRAVRTRKFFTEAE